MLAGTEPPLLLAFAGIWRCRTGLLTKGRPALELDVFSFMAAPQFLLVATINHERMPIRLADPAGR